MEGGEEARGDPGARNGLEEQQIFGLRLHVLPEDHDDFDMLVNLPAGFRARIGLNETTLTRALARGDFAMAEKIIEEATDVEFLNDGALSATPLNMVLTGRSSFFHQSRNLKLAYLLLQKGANPNLRIPNHDMESASESPLELLLVYYLKLVEVFGLPGSGQCRTSYRPNSFEETELMDCVGINGEIGGLGPGQITSQARQLLLYCLESGGDTNLPTTDAAKTIYHLAVVSPTPDPVLVSRLLELGANVNHADVHNTTPLMDLIMLGDEDRARAGLASMAARHSLVLDSQNCSLQSALWRAVYQGHTSLALDLLHAGASQGCSARVQPLPRPSTRVPRQTNIKAGVPPLLAPFLHSSPCTANLHVRLPKKRTGHTAQEYSALASIHLTRNNIAPLVDMGYMQDQAMADITSTLIRLNTDHTQAGDSKVVDSKAIIPLMFGELSAGLRQLAVRTILRHTLFSSSQEETLARLDKVCERNGFMLTQLLVKPSMTKLAQHEETMMTHEYEIELGSEMELSFGLDHNPVEEVVEDKIDLSNIELGIGDIALSEVPFSTADELSVSDTSYFTENSDRLGQELSEDLIESFNGNDNQGLSDNDEGHVIDIFETIDKLDRELEVIRTDSVLQTLDRDLATWEVELQGTLDRIQRYQAELSGEVDRGLSLVRRGREDRGIEEARRRSEQLMEELRLQRSILLRSDKDIKEAEDTFDDAFMGCYMETEVEDHVVPNPCEDAENMRRSGAEESLYWERRRRRIDENWSLGAERVLVDDAERVLEDDAEYSESDVVPADGRPLDQILSTVCPMCLDVYHGTHDCIMMRPSVVQPLTIAQASPENHTEELVQTLSVSVSVSKDPLVSRLPGLTEVESDSDSTSWLSQPGDQATPTSPQTMANNLVILNERLFQQRRRIGAAAISVVDSVGTPPPPLLTPSPPPLRDPFSLRMPGYSPFPPPRFRSPPVPPLRHRALHYADTTPSSAELPGLVASSDSEPESENSSDTSDTEDTEDTWGGTFSLRHTRRQEDQVDPPTTDATIVSRLTPRTLYALTDSLGIPHTLRPCFAVEAARLQLSLALFTHQAIACDRNCEGDESDSDSEDDWLATDTDTEEETADEIEREQPPLTNSEHEDEDSTDTSISDFSRRSWFGSQAELTEARRLSPRSTFSPPLSSSPSSETSHSSREQSWLPDREDLRRMRQFLSSSPSPEFHHSTDSESESSGL